MTKKDIIKKYTGKGGPTLQRVGNTVRNVVRNITKGNDPVPKESVERPNFPTSTQSKSVQIKTKPIIPYSTTSSEPGPANFSNIVVPSQRIPAQANLKGTIPSLKTTDKDKRKILKNSINPTKERALV